MLQCPWKWGAIVWPSQGCCVEASASLGIPPSALPSHTAHAIAPLIPSFSHCQVFEATLAAAAEVAAAKEGAGEGGAAAGLKLEDPSVLREPGTHPGQTRVVREGGTGMAYSWNAARCGGGVVEGGGGSEGVSMGGEEDMCWVDHRSVGRARRGAGWGSRGVEWRWRPAGAAPPCKARRAEG